MKKNKVMSSILFLAVIVVSTVDMVSAYTRNIPNRRDRSGIDYAVFTSSFIPYAPSMVSSTQAVIISSGGVGLYGIYVSSPGVNSKITLYNDSSTQPFAVRDNPFDAPLTNTQGWIPYNMDVSTGGTNDGLSVVIGSAAASGTATFIAPSLRIMYERKK